jgi:hypothetical protein
LHTCFDQATAKVFKQRTREFAEEIRNRHPKTMINKRIPMRRILTIAASIVLASALAACGREPATETAKPSSPNTTAPAPAVATPKSDVQSGYSPELERLLKASQGLRSSIQTLAQKQPGPQRTVAIAMTHQALNLTNQAMSQLTPEMRADPTPTTGSIGSQLDNPQSMEALQKAAEQLVKSAQAMADEPAGERRNAAVKAVQQALKDTNQAMIQLPAKAADKK